MAHRTHELAALFAAAMATLLFEVTVTKIFEFNLWANYAYMVISTAMFGLGFSGVVLTRWPGLLTVAPGRFLAGSSWACAAGILVAFAVINGVPIHLPDAPAGWGPELLHVAIVFVALALPYVCFGLLVSYLFEHRGEAANVYYFADLVGAGLGAFALVPLIPRLAPQGLVALCAGICAAAGGLFLLSGGAPAARRRTAAVLVVLAAAAATAWCAPRLAAWVPLNVHVIKRTYNADIRAGRIERTAWSALSRVDIAKMPRGEDRKRVWIAGGINESAIVRFDGDFARLRAKSGPTIAHSARAVNAMALPHLLKTNHTVCVIGTSGGADSLFALECGARHVVGVEMDPGIANFVTRVYRDYAGGLFTDGDYSELVVDEGRSYLRRAGRRFDVIQQVNNFTPIAFQNGALNLSETYLLTVESFVDFHRALTDDGILCINRYGSIRLLSTAVEMFRRMGMKPEEYARHLFVGRGPTSGMNVFMMKKSAFTPQEIDRLFDFYREGGRPNGVLYAPYRTAELPDLADNLYHRIATAPDPSLHWRLGCFDFSPPTDAHPFFNRMKVLGARDTDRDALKALPSEIRVMESRNKLDRRVPQGDLPPLVVLAEAAVLSLVFFGLPLMTRPDLRDALRRGRRALGYFACLGAGFIFVEICLIQRLILFLGAPVYSIATILCSLLVFAGLGSLASGRLPAEPRAMRGLLWAVAAAVLLTYHLMPLATDAFLGSPLGVRIAVAMACTGVAGFLMGMPMPTAIRMLSAENRPLIPWAWATNGFFTVVGSAAAVLLASTVSFGAVFHSAAALYALAPLFLRRKS